MSYKINNFKTYKKCETTANYVNAIKTAFTLNVRHLLRHDTIIIILKNYSCKINFVKINKGE